MTCGTACRHPWTPWFQKAGLALAEPVDSLAYDDAGLMLDAAIAGHGVALVRKIIAHDSIASGRLVACPISRCRSTAPIT